MRSVGRKTAAYMLFTGHPLTAEEAFNAGLVSRVTENDGLGNLIIFYYWFYNYYSSLLTDSFTI